MRRPPPALLSTLLLADLPWLGARPLVRDEVMSVEAGQRHLPALWHAVHQIDAPLGLYYLLLHPWLTVSTSAWWVRLPSLLAMVGAVAVLTVTAERVAGRRAAVVTALVALANPATWAFATFARPYALALLTAAVTLHVLLVRPRRAALMAVAATLTLYLQAMFVLLLVAEGLVLLRRRAWRLVAALAVAGLLWLPLGVLMLRQTTMTSWIPLTSPSSLATELHELFGEDGALSALAALLWVGLLLLALRQAVARRVFLLGAVPAGALAVAGLGLHVLGARYALYVVLTTALAVGLGMGRRRVPPLLYAGTGALIALSLLHEATLGFRQEDLPAAAAYLAQHDRAGDALLFDPDYARAGLLPSLSGDARDLALLPERDVRAVPSFYLPEESAQRLEQQVAQQDRLWVVGYPGDTWEPTPDTTDQVVRSLHGWRVASDRAFGQVHVRLLLRSG